MHKRLIKGPRLVNQAHRIYVYSLFDDMVQEIGPVDTILDLGCGTMSMAKFVDHRNYIGIDPNAKQLYKGLSRIPWSKGYVTTIEEIPDNLSGDLVLCIHCMGNRVFNPAMTIPCLERILNATRPSGHLFFTLMERCEECFGSVEQIVRERFEQVEVHKYGSFRMDLHWDRIAWILALAMRAWPKLAESSVRPARVYVCRTKKS